VKQALEGAPPRAGWFTGVARLHVAPPPRCVGRWYSRSLPPPAEASKQKTPAGRLSVGVFHKGASITAQRDPAAMVADGYRTAAGVMPLKVSFCNPTVVSRNIDVALGILIGPVKRQLETLDETTSRKRASTRSLIIMWRLGRAIMGLAFPGRGVGLSPGQRGLAFLAHPRPLLGPGPRD
jgi:hypothetical protein